MTASNNGKLLHLLHESVLLAGQYEGGYSGLFDSAEDFHRSLSEKVAQLESGDLTVLPTLRLWFLPTSAWDTFVGSEGMDLANQILDLLSDEAI